MDSDVWAKLSYNVGKFAKPPRGVRFTDSDIYCSGPIAKTRWFAENNIVFDLIIGYLPALHNRCRRYTSLPCAPRYQACSWDDVAVIQPIAISVHEGEREDVHS